MRVCSVAFACILLTSWVGPARGDWQNFNNGDGLANNRVLVIVEDSSRRLWFASGDAGGGVSCYDGINWEVYTTADGLADNRVDGIAEDQAGDLWFGTYGKGVSRYNGTGWRTYTTADGLVSNYVDAALCRRDGVLWFGGNGGVSSYDGEAWTAHTEGFTNSRVDAIAEDRSGNLWFATIEGAVRYDGASWRTFTIADGLADDFVHTVFADRNGRIWFGTHHGLSMYDGSTWQSHTEAGYEIYAIGEDRSGNLWFGDISEGLTRYDGTTWRRYSTADGLADNSVRAVLEDHAGNLWIGTSYRGACRYDGASWATYVMGATQDVPDTYHGPIYQIIEDRSGGLWFLSEIRDGLTYYDGATWRVFTEAGGLPGQCATTGLECSTGEMWFAMHDKYGLDAMGVGRYDGVSWTSYTAADGLADDDVHAIAEDRHGDLWFGTDGGASRFDGATWTTYTTADGLANNWVISIVEDSRGNLWFGTQQTYGVGGVTRYDGTTWQTYTMADGLAHNAVYSIFEDSDGRIWLRSLASGLSCYDGQVWRTYTTDDGLASNWVNVMFEDADRGLWFGTRAGLSRFDGTTWRSFTTADGLAGDYVLAISEARNGNLWVGSQGGVSRYDGAMWGSYTMTDGLPAPNVHSILEDRNGALWFGMENVRVVRHEPDRVLPYTRVFPQMPRLSVSTYQTVGFGTAYRDLRGITFSHSFDGSPWSDWSGVNFWQVSGLSDGEHTFVVRARDQIGNMDTTGATARFEIDATAPAPVISGYAADLPASVAGPAGKWLRGEVRVTGTSADPRFDRYRLEVRAAGTSAWASLAESSSPVTGGVLGSWNTAVVPDGEYEVRLSETDTLGLTGTALDRVIVDNHAPRANQTSPATVSAVAGGDVYTTQGDVHLYFPPRSFRADATVNVEALDEASVPETLPDGATRASAGYELTWGITVLEKPAVLEMSCVPGVEEAALTPPLPASSAIYVAGADSMWVRLGGTYDTRAGLISCTVTRSGRYAIFLEPGPASGPSSLSEISLIPRVFSPVGNFAADEVAISFTLGRPGPVTVKIYNRAGRLVREVASEWPMSSGANLVRWDGRDQSAALVPAGLYCVTIESLGETESKTVSVVR